jgi:hypothetical protein
MKRAPTPISGAAASEGGHGAAKPHGVIFTQNKASVTRIENDPTSSISYEDTSVA